MVKNVASSNNLALAWDEKSLTEKSANRYRQKEKWFAAQTREDKTIESAVPFPAPAKGDNRGLFPFNLGQYIALPFPKNHWSVQKISPRPLLRKPGLKGVNPFSPLYIIPWFVPVPFPCLPNNFFPGSPVIIDSFFHHLYTMGSNFFCRSILISHTCILTRFSVNFYTVYIMAPL